MANVVIGLELEGFECGSKSLVELAEVFVDPAHVHERIWIVWIYF